MLENMAQKCAPSISIAPPGTHSWNRSVPRMAAVRKRAAMSLPFVSDFTRAGFEVLMQGIRVTPNGERRLVVHAQKPNPSRGI